MGVTDRRGSGVSRRSSPGESASSARAPSDEPDALVDTFFEKAGIAFAFVSPDLRFLRVNAALCELTGRSESELIGAPVALVFPPEGEPSTVVEQALAESSGRVVVERKLRRPSAEPVWVRLEINVIRDSRGEPLFYVGVAQDVTAEREALEQLEAERRELVEAEAIAQVGSWHLNLDTDEGSCSSELRRIFEVGEDVPLEADSFLARVPAEEREDVRRRFRAAREEEQPFEWEHRLLRDDGSEGYVHARGHVVERDGTRWLVGTAQDVSDRKHAERAAAEATERFVTAFEDAPIGIAILSTGGAYLQVNPALCAMLGYSREQLLGLTFASLTHPDDLEANLAELNRLARGEKTTTRYEKRFLHARGHVVWATVAVSIVRDEIGEPLYLVAQIEDVSERKQAEQALAEATERFAKAFENAPFGMTLTAPDGRLIQANPAFCRILGYEQDLLLAKSFKELTHPDDVDVGVEHQEALLAGRELVAQFEKRYLHADGHAVWCRMSISLVRDDSGSPLYFVCQIEDISERRRLDEQLRRNAALLEEAQELTQVGSFEWDLETHEIRNSRELHRIHGTDPDTFVPTLNWLISVVHEDDRERMREAWTTHSAKPTESFCIVRADGAVRHLVTHARTQRDETGKPVRVFGAVQDVTERVEAEAERRELEARMQEAQRLESLGVLAGGIAHDFNNLLVGVLGNAGLAALELPPSSPARLLIDQIEIAARRAAELTKQMLAYSGRGQFVVQPLDLRVVVREMSALLESAIPKNVSVHYDFAEAMPAVRADVAQIRQLVMNLLTNAADAIGDAGGRIEIRIGQRQADTAFLSTYSLSEGLPEGTYVTLEVSDDGAGMDVDTLARIFDPFFTTKFGGHGLGLAAALGIVRGHRGAIRVESQKGRGSSFELLLPAVEDMAEKPGVLPVSDAWKASGIVLLVDDEEIVRHAAQRILATAGLTVVEAAGAAEALELFEKAPDRFDAALVDLVMPGMTGEKLVEALHELRPQLPVILTSGYDARAVLDALGETGARVDFLQKPYHPRDLLDCVRRRLAGG